MGYYVLPFIVCSALPETSARSSLLDSYEYIIPSHQNLPPLVIRRAYTVAHLVTVTELAAPLACCAIWNPRFSQECEMRPDGVGEKNVERWTLLFLSSYSVFRVWAQAEEPSSKHSTFPPETTRAGIKKEGKADITSSYRHPARDGWVFVGHFLKYGQEEDTLGALWAARTAQAGGVADDGDNTTTTYTKQSV